MLDLCYYLREYHLSNTAMLVYGLLDGLSKASAKRGKPYTYISRRSIGERIGKSERTAQRAVKELERANLIMVKRMGRNLNDHIFVFAPKTTQEEKTATVETANHSVYVSGLNTAKVSCPIVNTKKVISNQVDISINPENQRLTASNRQDDKGFTPKKGRPTNKRPHKDIAKETALRKHYTDLLKKQLDYEEYRRGMSMLYDDAEIHIQALNKMIALMANFMSGNSKVMVNGALLTKNQWWDIAKEATQEQILNIIWKIPHFQNVRKPQAYLLACIYNSALHETLMKPWYNNFRDNIY